MLGAKIVLFQNLGLEFRKIFIENFKEIEECPLSFPVGVSFCFFCFMFFCCDNEVSCGNSKNMKHGRFISQPTCV